MTQNKAEFLNALTERNNKELTKKLNSSSVGIAGCGGLGSNIAVSLARIGIGKLVLVDFDVVSMSNLNRQYFFLEDLGRYKTEALAARIHQFNPFVELEMHNVKITPTNLYSLFKQTSIIVEAFDLASEKFMIIDTFLNEKFNDKYLVCGSGLAGNRSSNLICTKKLRKNIYISGDFTSEPDSECIQGLMAPRVNIAVGHQANMVTRIIDGQLEP